MGILHIRRGLATPTQASGDGSADDNAEDLMGGMLSHLLPEHPPSGDFSPAFAASLASPSLISR